MRICMIEVTRMITNAMVSKLHITGEIASGWPFSSRATFAFIYNVTSDPQNRPAKSYSADDLRTRVSVWITRSSACKLLALKFFCILFSIILEWCTTQGWLLYHPAIYLRHDYSERKSQYPACDSAMLCSLYRLICPPYKSPRTEKVSCYRLAHCMCSSRKIPVPHRIIGQLWVVQVLATSAT